MVPKNMIWDHRLKMKLNSAQNDAVLLIICHIVSLVVLETTFIYLWEGEDVVEPMSCVCSLSLGHYGTQYQHWGTYTQELAQLTMQMMLYCWKYNTWWAWRCWKLLLCTYHKVRM